MIVGLSQKNLLGVKYKLVVVYNFSDKSHWCAKSTRFC